MPRPPEPARRLPSRLGQPLSFLIARAPPPELSLLMAGRQIASEERLCFTTLQRRPAGPSPWPAVRLVVYSAALSNSLAPRVQVSPRLLPTVAWPMARAVGSFTLERHPPPVTAAFS